MRNKNKLRLLFMAVVCLMPLISSMHAYATNVYESETTDGQEDKELKTDVMLRLSIISAASALAGLGVSLFARHEIYNTWSIDKQAVMYSGLLAIIGPMMPAILHFSGLAQFPSDKRFYNMLFKNRQRDIGKSSSCGLHVK